MARDPVIKPEGPSAFAWNISKILFHYAMKGKWEEVVDIYAQNKEAHTTKITRTGETALHIAILERKDDYVEKLVKSIKKAGTMDALKIVNEGKNTPLHLAATIGNVRMCKCIAEVDKTLIGVRNQDNETPLFLAALNGKKDAFLCLHNICGEEQSKSYYRRNDGETILHVAIFGEYFDFAYQIMHLHNELVNSINERGLSPLHLLATKPTAFRSGSHIRWLDKIIYHCTFIDELVVDKSYRRESSDDEEGVKYPQNYETCMNSLKLLRDIILHMFFGMGKQQDTEAAKGGKANEEATATQTQADPSQQHCGMLKFINWFPLSMKKSRQPETKAANKDCGMQKFIINWFPFNRKKSKQPDTEAAKGSVSQEEEAVHRPYPANYHTCFETIKFISKAMLIILGLGSKRIVKIRRKKEKHVWSVQILDKLLEHASTYEFQYEDDGRMPHQHLPSQIDGETLPYSPHAEGDKKRTPQMANIETPILIAAKNGIAEIVQKIRVLFPVAIHDMDSNKRNIVLLAVENRQSHVYKLLCDQKSMRDTIFRKVDKDGNTALHLAAKLGGHRPWRIAGAALQMQWEIKWYKFVKNSMPVHYFPRYNNEGKTANEKFTETHMDLVKNGGEWLTSTSESCSVVAALIATVAFATSAAIPGGVKEENGTPNLEKEPAFSVFATSSLVALCSSLTSVVMFLAILTSRFQEKDFGKTLPVRVLLGLFSLFVSIAAMLVSFCAGHFFVLKDNLKYAAFPIYAVTCFPVTLFAIAQFRLYIDLIWASLTTLPQRSFKAMVEDSKGDRK